MLANLNRTIILDSGNSLYEQMKRCLDVSLSLAALVTLLPLIALCALAIRLDSPGPAFFSQRRVGRESREFALLKLRTMRMNSEESGPQWAAKNDHRITRIGRLLRRYRLDELPQLWNVVKGEMSLVGPRPERKIFVERFSMEMPEFRFRTLVLPGLTGWAQVNGGYDLDPAKKLELDLHYIRHRSLWFDLIILLRTVPIVVGGAGAR